MRSKKLGRITILGLSLLFLGYIFFCLVSGMPFAYDYRSLRNRETPGQVADAFSTALRNNDEAAYELTSPPLWPRLDEWMNTHRVRKCSGFIDGDRIYGFGTPVKESNAYSYDLKFACDTKDGGYAFNVEGIIVGEEDLLVKDWGEITETD